MRDIIDKNKKASDFLDYLNEKNEKISVWCTLSELTQSFIKVELLSGSILIVPIHRIIQFKRKNNSEGDNNGR